MPQPDTFSVTTAIAYVNGPPHIGHALEFVEGDAIARYHRLIGKDVFFLTGTDEHGTKIVQTAEKEGVSVRELVDRNAQKFKDMMSLYQIGYDGFIRTADRESHWPGVQKLWMKMVEKGDIYKGEYKGLYCVGCEEYKNEKDLVDGQCVNHPTRQIQQVEQSNYFFKLSKYSDRIGDLLKTKVLRIVPEFRANEIIAMCDSGLEDVSFSRPKEQLSWGIPVPGDDSQVMYVWADALSNYITGLGYATESDEFKKYWPADLHIIGKDILRFHAGIWIGMLLSAELPLPKAELVHGWIHFQGGRMSKSSGNVVDPVVLAEHYGIDMVRYFLLSEIPVGQDGNFSYELFENKVNAELANNLGNLVNRVISMTEKFFEGSIPNPQQDIPAEVQDLWREYHQAFQGFDHQKAAQIMIRLSHHANLMIAEQKPWEMAKNGQLEELECLMSTLLKVLLHLAFMLEPFCPEKARLILACFGLTDSLNSLGLKELEENILLQKAKKIQKGEILFHRIEVERSLVSHDTT
jgi:methionyl-tRNA synthetase